MAKKVFLLAAEPSADLLGGELIRKLRERSSPTLLGVGGPHMRAEGLIPLLPMEEFQLMGIVDTILNFPKLLSQFKTVRNAILQENPDTVVLIDYPGFHLRLAKSLRKHGYSGKLVQYVSPTVWAWGKKRIETIGKYYDDLLCIFPFEPPLYSHTPVRATYIGSPVAEIIEKHRNAPPLSWMTGKKVIALFPGSRKREILNNFPLELRVARHLLQQNPDLAFGVSCSHPDYLPLLQSSFPLHIVPRDETYSLMRHCHLAIAKSGTCNLELALFEKPSVVVYHVDPLNRFLANHLLRLNLTHVSMPNIIAGQTIFPEFVLHPYREEELFEAASELMEGKQRERCVASLRELKGKLEDGNAAEKAAEIILS